MPRVSTIPRREGQGACREQALDEDLVAEIEAGDEALSAQVNDAVRAELERRRHHRLLTEQLDELDAIHGPPDEKLVRTYADLLG